MFLFNNTQPNGGMPAYIDDILNLQNLSLSISQSPISDYNCVLSGMEVDEVNINTKTVKVLPGYFLIDKVYYYFSGYTGQYPFEIIPSDVTTDSRVFLDGNEHVVGTEYNNYNINTSFPLGFDLGGYPNKYSGQSSVKAIYFDPFTCQRASFIMRNIIGYMPENDIKLIKYNNYINNTETGKGIVGGSLNTTYYYTMSYLTNNNRTEQYNYKWNNIGWCYLEDDNNNKYLKTGNVKNAGNNNIYINELNLPQHQHDKGTLAPVLNFRLNFPYNIATNTGGSEVLKTYNFESGNAIGYNNSMITISNNNSYITGSTGNGNGQNLPITINPEFTSLFKISRSTFLPYNFFNKPLSATNTKSVCWNT